MEKTTERIFINKTPDEKVCGECYYCRALGVHWQCDLVRRRGDDVLPVTDKDQCDHWKPARTWQQLWFWERLFHKWDPLYSTFLIVDK